MQKNTIPTALKRIGKNPKEIGKIRVKLDEYITIQENVRESEKI